MITINRMLGAFVLLAGLSLAAPQIAEAQVDQRGHDRHCINDEGAVDMGKLRGATICYNPTVNPTIREADCLNTRRDQGPDKRIMKLSAEGLPTRLYCVTSGSFWERFGHQAQELIVENGPMRDKFGDKNHCTNHSQFEEVVGTYNGATVCRLNGSGMSTVSEYGCGHPDVKSWRLGTLVTYGSEKYCISNVNGGWWYHRGHTAALVVPLCEVRWRGQPVASRYVAGMTAEDCAALMKQD